MKKTSPGTKRIREGREKKKEKKSLFTLFFSFSHSLQFSLIFSCIFLSVFSFFFSLFLLLTFSISHFSSTSFPIFSLPLFLPLLDHQHTLNLRSRGFPDPTVYNIVFECLYRHASHKMTVFDINVVHERCITLSKTAKTTFVRLFSQSLDGFLWDSTLHYWPFYV